MDSLEHSDKLKYRYDHRIDRKAPPIINNYQNQATFNRQIEMEFYEQQQQTGFHENKEVMSLKSCDKEVCKPLAKESDLKISRTLDRFKVMNSDEGKIPSNSANIL